MADVVVLHAFGQSNFAALVKGEGERASVEAIIKAILTAALQKGATAISIKPTATEMFVHFRVNGVAYEILRPPLKFRDAITDCIKQMADLDVNDRHSTQHGIVRVRFRDRRITREMDVLVSSFPIQCSEQIVVSLDAPH
jgi:type II secretory ATPase GspE/PulE/Tfp pilus assembly ATPase PilB-like protein